MCMACALHARRCAHLFELLGQKQSDVFFHADQIIRGLYAPFVVDWHAALGSTGVCLVRVDDLLGGKAAETRAKLLAFLGLPAAAAAELPPPRSDYRAFHAASLRAVGAQPMLPSARRLAEAFYAPYDAQLAALFPSVAWPHGSTAVDAAAIAAAPQMAGARFD